MIRPLRLIVGLVACCEITVWGVACLIAIAVMPDAEPQADLQPEPVDDWELWSAEIGVDA